MRAAPAVALFLNGTINISDCLRGVKDFPPSCSQGKMQILEKSRVTANPVAWIDEIKTLGCKGVLFSFSQFELGMYSHPYFPIH